jgi:DNA invertase Pin-like site-specific DNA recombinase
MKAAIYMRTSRHDKGHHAYSLRHQESQARELASKHGLPIADAHVFSDIDYPGDAPPSCWVSEDDPRQTRPALAALVNAVEEGYVKRVIVRRMERLGTAADTLAGLCNLFTRNGVLIIATPENVELDDDPSEAFAISILRPCIRYDTDAERERKLRQKAKNIEEIQRLQDKIARLESEIAELNL